MYHSLTRLLGKPEIYDARGYQVEEIVGRAYKQIFAKPMVAQVRLMRLASGK